MLKDFKVLRETQVLRVHKVLREEQDFKVPPEQREVRVHKVLREDKDSKVLKGHKVL